MAIIEVEVVEGIHVNQIKQMPKDMLGDFAKYLLERLARDVGSESSIAESEKLFLSEEIANVISGLEEILSLKNKKQRETMLRLLISALSVNFIRQGGIKTYKKLNTEFTMNRIGGAVNANICSTANDLIANLCKSEWAINPHLRDQPKKTAGIILPSYITQIQIIAKSYKIKKSLLLNEKLKREDEEKRLIEVIMQRITRAKKRGIL